MVTEFGDFRYRSDEAEISRARGEVRRFLVALRLRSDLVDDLALVVDELVTNAVEHGTGTWVVVELDIDPNLVSISVTQEGSAELGDPSSWIMPPETSRSGRGLALVRRLVDVVEWSQADDRLKVRVDRRYRND